MLNFVPIQHFNLSICNSGESHGRIIIFKTKNGNDGGEWERVEGSQIIIVGKEAKLELQKLVQIYGRPTINEIIPGGIAGRAYLALRKHLGIIK